MVSTLREKKKTAPLGGEGLPAPESTDKKIHHSLRQARILLRQVDSVLKTDGINAAMTALVRVRLETPLNTIIRSWLRDYRDMLDAWQAELMPEVVDEFQEYGFRRARDIAHRSMGAITQERVISYYLICERVFAQMAERKRLSVRDVEELPPEKWPEVFSLDDVSEEELERAIKY